MVAVGNRAGDNSSGHRLWWL